jgi:uncharacterized protein YlxW (UPF0749 family)
MRLLDLVKTLQKRVEELNDKALDHENKLNEQRRRSATLEKQLEKNKLHDPKTASNSNLAGFTSKITCFNVFTRY